VRAFLSLCVIGLAIGINVPSRAQMVPSVVTSLCEPQETVLFNCQVRTGIGSLCATKKTATRSAQTFYRFGSRRRLQMTFPTSNDATNPSISASYVDIPGGGQSHVTFTRGGYSYVLYDAMYNVEGKKDSESRKLMRTGIAILRGRTVISDRACIGDTKMDWSVHELLPTEQFQYFNGRW
jgi:hypothetical protein